MNTLELNLQELIKTEEGRQIVKEIFEAAREGVFDNTIAYPTHDDYINHLKS